MISRPHHDPAVHLTVIRARGAIVVDEQAIAAGDATTSKRPLVEKLRVRVNLVSW